jgi:hypothetical protein
MRSQFVIAYFRMHSVGRMSSRIDPLAEQHRLPAWRNITYFFNTEHPENTEQNQNLFLCELSDLCGVFFSFDFYVASPPFA